MGNTHATFFSLGVSPGTNAGADNTPALQSASKRPRVDRAAAAESNAPPAKYVHRLPLPPASPRSITDLYDVGECVGRGGFSSVHRATRRDTGERVALKYMNLNKVVGPAHALYVEQLHEEIRVMAFLSRDRVKSHAREDTTVHTPLLLDWFVTPAVKATRTHAPAPERIVVASTFAEGGNLYDAIRDDVGSSDKAVARRMNLARRVLKAVCKELAVLHAADFVHDDVKLENVLLKDRLDAHDGDALPATLLTTTFLLADLGLVRDLERQRQGFAPLHGNDFGTEYILAPELRAESGRALSERNPTFASDMYAAGLLVFQILTGYDSPHFGTSKRAWLALPPGARELIVNLLDADAARRPSAKAALDVIWKRWSPHDDAVAIAVAEGALPSPRDEAPSVLTRRGSRRLDAFPLAHGHASLSSHAKDELVDFARSSIANYEQLALAFSRRHPRGLANKAELRDVLAQELRLSVGTVDALLDDDRLYDLIDSDHSGHIDWRELCTLLPLVSALAESESGPVALASLPDATLRLLCLVWDADRDGCLTHKDLTRMKGILRVVSTDATSGLNVAMRELAQSAKLEKHMETCYRRNQGPVEPFRHPQTGLFSPCADCCFYYKDPTDTSSMMLLRDKVDYETVLNAVKRGGVTVRR